MIGCIAIETMLQADVEPGRNAGVLEKSSLCAVRTSVRGFAESPSPRDHGSSSHR
ncbi:MAG: hypothetical protein P8Y93_14260 [Acidobacteriota bacterium]